MTDQSTSGNRWEPTSPVPADTLDVRTGAGHEIDGVHGAHVV